MINFCGVTSIEVAATAVATAPCLILFGLFIFKADLGGSLEYTSYRMQWPVILLLLHCAYSKQPKITFS